MIRNIFVVLAAAACVGVIVEIVPPSGPAVSLPIVGVPSKSTDAGTRYAVCIQGWPYYAPSCLRDSYQPDGMARVVRVVTADGLTCGSHCTVLRNPRREAMSAISRQAVNQAFVILGFVSHIIAAPAAPASPSTFGSEQQILIAVDRTNKSDRLPSAMRAPHIRQSFIVERHGPTSAKAPPFGCDPAFSPVTNPKLASIYKRCMT